LHLWKPSRNLPPKTANLEIIERTRGDYQISTDRDRLDLNVIHDYLSNHSYWAQGIPFEIVKRSVAHSLCFGIYHGSQQVGFARLITDYATIAYLGDVFVLPEHRGKGLSKWLIETMTTHPDLQGFRRWMLLTADAHGLYEQYGFKSLASPNRWMERHIPNVYQQKPD
jgi:GNAT superfamily N-acetyltransferase